MEAEAARGAAVVAVYLKESWWSIEDALRTSDPSREGLVKVQSFGERIVLFILNVIIFGRLERRLDDDDMFFLPHPENEKAKILWRDGAAVGFYTIKMKGKQVEELVSLIPKLYTSPFKPLWHLMMRSDFMFLFFMLPIKGSLCGDGTGACYLLPVFDTVFVRREHRRRGLGTAMLRDFCETFREDDALGISCPISPAMFQVCRQFLSARPEDRGRLWEVEPPGAWGQRASIWLKVQLRQAGLPEVQPRSSKEDLSDPGQSSRDDGGPAQVASGESHKEQVCGEEPESTKSDRDCGVKEEEAELDGKEAKKTVAAPRLVGAPWRPSS